MKQCVRLLRSTIQWFKRIYRSIYWLMHMTTPASQTTTQPVGNSQRHRVHHCCSQNVVRLPNVQLVGWMHLLIATRGLNQPQFHSLPQSYVTRCASGSTRATTVLNGLDSRQVEEELFGVLTVDSTGSYPFQQQPIPSDQHARDDLVAVPLRLVPLA